MRVLVVDDVPETARLVSRMLLGSGYEVLEANDGGDALAQLRWNAVDVLVTDVRMPGMSGPELVRRAREFAPGLPVVFITGYATGDEIPPEMLSSTLLLAKPFAAVALRNAVAAALDGGMTLGALITRKASARAAARDAAAVVDLLSA